MKTEMLSEAEVPCDVRVHLLCCHSDAVAGLGNIWAQGEDTEGTGVVKGLRVVVTAKFFEVFGRKDVDCGAEVASEQVFDHKYK